MRWTDIQIGEVWVSNSGIVFIRLNRDTGLNLSLPTTVEQLSSLGSLSYKKSVCYIPIGLV